jgi:hypothetical protein
MQNYLYDAYCSSIFNALKSHCSILHANWKSSPCIKSSIPGQGMQLGEGDRGNIIKHNTQVIIPCKLIYDKYFKHYYRCSDMKHVIIIVYFLQILVDHLRMSVIISQCFPLVLMNQNNIVSAMDWHDQYRLTVQLCYGSYVPGKSLSL